MSDKTIEDIKAPPWQYLHDTVLFKIFQFLPSSTLLRASRTCKNWLRVAGDEFLWKDLFYREWKINRSISIFPGRYSWREEYHRLSYHVPRVEGQVIKQHRNQVLHVSFAHNGQMFATTSKDGTIQVWDCSCYPVRLLYKHDMKELTWKYTQFSQFNDTDTYLMVLGIHFGTSSTSGEIAVFSLVGGFELQCRIINKPYDLFGSWYNTDHVLSGTFYWQGSLTSCSAIWLNTASQGIESEHDSVVMRLLTFHNVNGSTIRNIMIANCLDDENSQYGNSAECLHSESDLRGSNDQLSIVCKAKKSGNTATTIFMKDNETDCPGENVCNNDSENDHRGCCCRCQSNKRDIGCNDMTDLLDRSKMCYKDDVSCNLRVGDHCMDHDGEIDQDNHASRHSNTTTSESEHSLHAGDVCNDEECRLTRRINTEENLSSSSVLLNNTNKRKPCDANDVDNVTSKPVHLCHSQTDDSYMDTVNDETLSSSSVIYESTCNLCAILKSSNPSSNKNDVLPINNPKSRFRKHCDKYLIFERGSKTYVPHEVGIKRLKMLDSLPTVAENCHSLDHEVFDNTDYVFEFDGHIIGMSLSPDHRLLFVNVRAWPQGYIISHALEPPPIAQEIDLHTIDLVHMTKTGVIYRGHRAYTPNDECFFLFMDATNEYIASGAENKQAYVWDRHYHKCLSKLPHSDVVNAVAFNPCDPEMMVSVSDDNSIKIWYSRHRKKDIDEICTAKMKDGEEDREGAKQTVKSS